MSDFVIRTLGLTRSFGELVAVDSLGLDVPRGCVYGFLGPNGAGKTTTIRMLLGLIKPDRGSVELFGHSLTGNRTAVLGRLGALVEGPSLYPHLSGRENLEVTRRLTGAPRGRIDEALETVGLRDNADRSAAGYSSGMKQRLGLATALLGRPELLVLDEPTNGLDPAGIREMREMIRDLPERRGVTVFLSSHLLGEVEQVADFVGIIHLRKLLFQGALADLQARRLDYLVLEVDEAPKALGLLRDRGWKATQTDGGKIIVAGADRSVAAGAATLLVGAGISVFLLELKRPTLEQTFLEMTRDAKREESV